MDRYLIFVSNFKINICVVEIDTKKLLGLCCDLYECYVVFDYLNKKILCFNYYVLIIKSGKENIKYFIHKRLVQGVYLIFVNFFRQFFLVTFFTIFIFYHYFPNIKILKFNSYTNAKIRNIFAYTLNFVKLYNKKYLIESTF